MCFSFVSMERGTNIILHAVDKCADTAVTSEYYQAENNPSSKKTVDQNFGWVTLFFLVVEEESPPLLIIFQRRLLVAPFWILRSMQLPTG